MITHPITNGKDPAMSQENPITEAIDQPADQPTALPMAYLPDLHAMAEWASFMQGQAEHLLSSGQRIVSDFKAQLDSLVAEAASLEAERQEAIAQIDRAHECRLARNAAMRANVEAMIAYHTGAMPTLPAEKPAEQLSEADRLAQVRIPRRPSRRRLFGSLVAGVR